MKKEIIIAILLSASMTLAQPGPGGQGGGPGGGGQGNGVQGGQRPNQNQNQNNTTSTEKAVPECKIEVKDGIRYITSNGIPDHSTGQFPNRGNPNTISAQHYAFQCPVDPKPADSQQAPARGLLFGVAIDGVPFDPGTAEFYNRDRSSGWNYEALSGKINLGLDNSNAHVQPNGAYHYHGIPAVLVKEIAGNKAGRQMTLVGYAADGYPIYAAMAYTDPTDAKSPVKEMKSSYRVKQGTRPSGPGGKYDGTFVQDMEYVKELGDLDENNGRSGVTPEYPEGTYYYMLTNQYPFIPRKFHGTPDNSFRKNDGPGGQRGPGQNGPGQNSGPQPGGQNGNVGNGQQGGVASGGQTGPGQGNNRPPRPPRNGQGGGQGGGNRPPPPPDGGGQGGPPPGGGQGGPSGPPPQQ